MGDELIHHSTNNTYNPCNTRIKISPIRLYAHLMLNFISYISLSRYNNQVDYGQIPPWLTCFLLSSFSCSFLKYYRNCKKGCLDIEGGGGWKQLQPLRNKMQGYPDGYIARRYLNILGIGKVMCERLATDSHITIIQAANPSKVLQDGGNAWIMSNFQLISCLSSITE